MSEVASLRSPYVSQYVLPCRLARLGRANVSIACKRHGIRMCMCYFCVQQ